MIYISKIDFYPDNFDTSSTYISNDVGVGDDKIFAMLLAPAVSFGVSKFINEHEENMAKVIPTQTINASSRDINEMNIIINDGDCSDSFFNEIVDILKEDGLRFSVTSNYQNINQDDSTVITLDQQYSGGEQTIIFAPYNNTRIGHSDSLALCMQSAFSQNGFAAEGILCGQSGFQEENGNVSYMVPTATEKAIDDNKDTSFVTISFGTKMNDPEWVAKSIENGLARQYHYLQEHDTQTDLIYRASEVDSLDVVAGYFGTDGSTLKSANKMNNDNFMNSQTIVNPSIREIDVFDDSSIFHFEGEKVRTY